MAILPVSFIDPTKLVLPKKAAAPVVLKPSGQNDVFLQALLETPTTKRGHRNPLQWASAAAFHVALIATLIIVPLYTTGTIHFAEYQDIPLVAPPAPPPPPAPMARGPVAARTIHPKAKLTYQLRKLRAPIEVPKKVSADTGDAAPPELADGVPGGLPGGVIGGQIGGAVGGVFGGTGPAAPPPPPPAAKPARKIVRVGSDLKAPRQTFSVDPEYPPLARQAHITGVVVVDAIIDEHGNVVQARALSGHPLLVDAALRAVLQWKYEPTSLNGQPISVELKVLVTFK